MQDFSDLLSRTLSRFVSRSEGQRGWRVERLLQPSWKRIPLFFAGLMIVATLSSRRNDNYALAEDLPNSGHAAGQSLRRSRSDAHSHRGAGARPAAVAEIAPTPMLRIRMPTEPLTLNPIASDGMAAGDIQAYVVETLLGRDERNYGWRPALADRWSAGHDGKSYDFHLRENAHWSDGEAVTADDVKFSFDVLFDDRFQTAMMRAYYEGIQSVEVLDARTVRFHTKDSYYGNFTSCAQITIVPRHIYQSMGENSASFSSLQSTLIGSGPYVIEGWDHGRSLTLKKNPQWWGLHDASTEGRYKLQTLRFVFVANDLTAIELLKNGDLDFSWLTPDQFLSESYHDPHRAAGRASRDARFQAIKTENEIPKNVKSIAFNLDKAIFKDLKVRQALSLLADRKGMIDHLFHGFMLPARGPWYSQSFYADPLAPAFAYDPARAFEILKSAGWEVRPGRRVLSKLINGVETPLRFTILTPKAQDERYLTIYQEAARQIGVQIDLKELNQTSFNSALASREFDAADVDHGAVLIEFDPRSTWNSGRLPPNGFNYSGYSNSRADSLIAQAMLETDLKKRIPLMQELYRTVNEDAPEVFLFNERDTFYAVSNRVASTVASYPFDLGMSYWDLNTGVHP